MTEKPLRILQVSTFDKIGGAEKVAWNLFKSYQSRGYHSHLAVGHKLSDDPDVLLLPNHDRLGRWSQTLLKANTKLNSLRPHGKGRAKLASLTLLLADPAREYDHYRGIEDFRFPGAWKVLELVSPRPDILHGHNLHGGYFDLRSLPWLSHQVPFILTLHDAWMLSGHCAHSFECQRWRTGCGHCPDLTIPPAVQRDATHYNWRRKRAIYARSKLYIATPSQWLMEKVEQSILTPAIQEARVIPNGVDLRVFHPLDARRPADKLNARNELNLSLDARFLLFSATDVRQNIWKDYQTVRVAAIKAAEELPDQEVALIVLGEGAPTEKAGDRVKIHFIPYQSDPMTVAGYFQAADVYVHAARVETFPNTIIEAQACGTAVVATAVGGIPEQVEDGRTGYLIPASEPEAMTVQLVNLLSNDDLLRWMSSQAAEMARWRFDLRQQVDAYLGWYHEVVNQRLESQPKGLQFAVSKP